MLIIFLSHIHSILPLNSLTSSPLIIPSPPPGGAVGDMEETPPRRLRRSPPPILLVLLSCLVLPLPNAVVFTSAAPINAPANSDSFTPPDNYLFNCGSPSPITAPGNRIFVGDPETGKYLSYTGKSLIATASQPDPTFPSPIYNTASVFESDATYTFHITRPGWHWIRLHFAPIQNNVKDLKTAKFQVTTTTLVLVQELESPVNATWTMKEFLVNVTTERFSVTFAPSDGSFAFINAIECVSAPDLLLGNVATAVFPKGEYSGMANVAYQTVYRLNSGGPVITAQNDTLGRNWDSDQPYLDPKFMGSVVSVQPNVITYPQGESPLIAPPAVYSTATQMADAKVQVACKPNS